MAVIKKTLFPKNLDKFAVLVNDTQSDSKYFKITELPNTFTGGKNAFLIAGSVELVPDTRIQIELKDSAGNIIYHEPGEGAQNSGISGSTNEPIITEYYEGVSKVVSVYIYPDTAYGPCTLTILGELSEYEDGNGILSPVPLDWENKYNVKWQRQIDVNPSLANTTKIRFYKRPLVKIDELISPIYRIDPTSGLKINSGINQSFANIKVSNLETFAGDVKRIKVFRTSLGDISDYDMIQDILVESKELLTTYGLTGSVVGNTGIFTSETLKNYWITGSLDVKFDTDRVESGVKLNGGGNFIYSSSLDLKSGNTYELNLDAFYSSSTSSNLGIYLNQITTSIQNNVEVPLIISSSITTLVGTQPTKNLLDTTISFKLDRNYPSASLYFSQSQGEWHLGNISLRLSEDTAFSPDEVSFITTMPTVVGNEDFNFKFEFYDVNNNYVPINVTGSANFTGGSNAITKLLTFESDRTAFRFSTGSFANPPSQFVKFKTTKTNYTGSITYGSSSFDINGNYIEPLSYAGIYPGALSSVSDNGALLSIASFSGSVSDILVGSITYTASCEGVEEYETIYRFEDGDNAPGVFVTANTNQFIYKATDLSLNPVGQIITIEAKRKNLGVVNGVLEINSGSGKPPLTLTSPTPINGVDTYTIAGVNYPFAIGETTYSITGSDQFGNKFSDAIKISPVKILDGFSINVSNENTSFPALSTGIVDGGYAASSGSLNVKVGNETINYSNTFITNSYSASISSTLNLTANTFNGINYSISNLTADSGSLTLLVKYKDGSGDIISGSRDITYSKAKKSAPVLNLIIGNNNQTVTAKSTGNQIDTFVASSFVVNETYNGLTSTKTFTPTNITSTNSYTTGTATATLLLLPNLSDGIDSVDISITGSVTDSENTTRLVFGNISLAKTKKAAPTTLALLSAETQTILSSSIGFAIPSTFTTTVTEGGGNYIYDAGLSSNSSFYITATNIVTNINGVIQPNTPTTTAGVIVTLTIFYKNSEGTTGTITKTHKVAVSLEGVKGTDGANGSPGTTGADGRRTATGMVFYQPSSTNSPTTPSATSYTFSSNSFGGLTLQWGIGAPTYAAGNTNKYWYSTYTAVETTAGSGTAVPTFSAPAQAINFTGLVTFTSTNNITDGVNTSNIVEPGSVTNHIGGANVTTIEGGKISTGIITSTGYILASGDTLASGSFMSAGTIFNLNNGSLRSKNFYVDSSGNAFFKGDISGASGTFSGNLSGATITGGTIAIGTGNNIFKADTNGIYLGNTTFASAPFRVTTTGILTATSANISGAITATSLTLSAGVTISNSQVSGLGTLATADGVTTAQVSGLGALATQDTVTNTQVTGLGALATLGSLAFSSSYLTGFGALAARSTVNQTYIDDNSITTDKILANAIVAGKVASLEFYGKTAKFDTGDVGGWIMDGTGLYKTVAPFTLRLGANAQRISINETAGQSSIDRVRIDASPNIDAIVAIDTGSLNWSNSNQLIGTHHSAFEDPSIGEYGGDFTLADGGSNQYGTGVFGIVGLQYAEEEIFVESEAFPDISNTIFGGSGFDVNDYVYGYYNCTLRVRKYPSDIDAINQTNQDSTFGTKEILLAYREFRYSVSNSDNNIDKQAVYGGTVQAKGGGSINTAGTALWYRIEIKQFWRLEAAGPSGFDNTISGRRPAFDIYVKFGRVNNGYSVFSPGGLQVYQGIRNYLNASVPAGTIGEDSNFFTVKGKSEIIGSLNVTSGLSANNKQFKIQHPLNENKWLYHTSTESPRADLIYRGTIQLQNGEGSASIDIQSNMTIGTFDVLTKNPQLFLQNNETFDRVKGKVENGNVYVLSENKTSNALIDWKVISERCDEEILKSPLYNTNGIYNTENYKGEYLELTRKDRFINFSGSI